MRHILGFMILAFSLGLAISGLADSVQSLMSPRQLSSIKSAVDIPESVPEPTRLASLFESTKELPSPKNRIKEKSILVYPDRVVINVSGARWSTFTDTNSMDPVLDVGANAIQIEPEHPTDIEAGDIVSYRTHNSSVIHRVIETGEDGIGWYAITQGDNNSRPDPQKVRFWQVQRVVIAIIY